MGASWSRVGFASTTFEVLSTALTPRYRPCGDGGSVITRRDFLNGMAIAMGSGLVGSPRVGAAEPHRAGAMLGQGDGPMGLGHALRDGARFDPSALPVEAEHDLVVVGAGLSGLAAAWAFHKHNPRARVLLLESHEEPGGHALRVELPVSGGVLTTYGGSESMQSPQSYNREVLEVLQELGVQLPRFETAFHRTLYPSLSMSRGIFFDREHFGVDRLVSGDPTPMVADDIPAGQTHARSVAAFVADLPLAAAEQAMVAALYEEPRDVLAGIAPKSAQRKRERALEKMSYRSFLTRQWGLSERAADAFQNRSHDYYAIGIDLLPAAAAREMGLPGFQGLGLAPLDVKELEDPYIHHFPDGNASLARALLGALIPGSVSAGGMEEIATARLLGDRLDRDDQAVRLRTNAMVLFAKNAKGAVSVGYVRDGTLHHVRARRLVYAGFASAAPFLLPELSARPAQLAAFQQSVRAPLVYVKVAVRNWRPWVERGVHEVFSPTGFFARTKLDYPVSLGAARFPSSPDAPMALHLVHIPTPSHTGVDQREAWRRGRQALLAMTFDDFEGQVRDHLTRLFGAAGFEAPRDLLGIAVCRWAHGYAYEHNPLFDAAPAERSLALLKRPLGRIAFAGSDVGWAAYADAAIEHGLRAILPTSQSP